MWRFLLPSLFAVPLLWTVVAEWRLVVDPPAANGGSSDSSAAAGEKCVISSVGVDDANKGYGAWAAIALRIDKSDFADDKSLKSPWKELRDQTKDRVASLGKARQFTELYRKGEEAKGGDAVVDTYKKAFLEERAVDVKLLQAWGQQKRVADAATLEGHRKDLAKSKTNRVAHKVLARWIEVNEVLNGAPWKKRRELFLGALKHVKDHPNEPPFTEESEKKIDYICKQLKIFADTKEELWGLKEKAKDELPWWNVLLYLKNKVRAVEEIVAQMEKDEKNH